MIFFVMYKIMEAFLENSCTFINWCVKDDLSVKIAFRKRRVRGIKSYFYYLNLGNLEKTEKYAIFGWFDIWRSFGNNALILRS